MSERPRKVTSKNVLWANVLALMVHKWGKENLTGFAAWAGIGVGSVQRIKEQKTSVGLDIVDKIAHVAKVHPWHLLVPGVDLINPPLVPNETLADMKKLIASVQQSTETLSGMLHIEGNTNPGDFHE